MIGGVEIRQLLGSVDGGTEVVWVNLRTLEMCDFDTLLIRIRGTTRALELSEHIRLILLRVCGHFKESRGIWVFEAMFEQ